MLTAACFALSPPARAVDPPPDGGYPEGNTAEGDDALLNLTTGSGNTALGFHALYNADFAGANTAVGWSALLSNTDGGYNTAVGAQALFGDATGSNNTAVGYSALAGRPGGGETDNVAVGYRAMENGHGLACVAIGSNTLRENTGDLNTAVGKDAMQVNKGGQQNSAYGWRALGSNRIGSNNTAVGGESLYLNTTGGKNTVTGTGGMLNNTSGSGNVAYGYNALSGNTTGAANTAVGTNALVGNTIGSSNIALGTSAGSNLNGDNNIDIGNVGLAEESDVIRIGTADTHANAYIAGISGATVAGGVGVIIDSQGHLGTVVSSERFKDNVKPMDNASEVILELQPVTFHYKHDLDPIGIPQFGVVAEQVEKVNPDLVARDDKGRPYSVRYEAVNAMLLNEFLKEHRKVREQEATIVQLKKDFQAAAAHQQEQIEALTAGLQKVSAQVEMSRPAPQMVLNNQ